MAETKFSVGDKVIGNEKANAYGLTREGWKGEVKAVRGGLIDVEGLGIGNAPYVFTYLGEDCFDLVSDSPYTHTFTLSRSPYDMGFGNSLLRFSTDFGKKDNSAKERTMTKLTDAQQRNLSDDAKALVQAGYYDEDLTLHDEDHFMNFLLNKFESEYAAQAKAELQEEADKKALADGTK